MTDEVDSRAGRSILIARCSARLIRRAGRSFTLRPAANYADGRRRTGGRGRAIGHRRVRDLWSGAAPISRNSVARDWAPGNGAAKRGQTLSRRERPGCAGCAFARNWRRRRHARRTRRVRRFYRAPERISPREKGQRGFSRTVALLCCRTRCEGPLGAHEKRLADIYLFLGVALGRSGDARRSDQRDQCVFGGNLIRLALVLSLAAPVGRGRSSAGERRQQRRAPPRMPAD